MPEEEIKKFKKEFFKIVNVFFALQDHYMHDNNKVFKEIKLFRKYLNEFNKRYPHFDIMLEEEDLTSDDLKILLIGYKTEEDIARKIKTTEKIPMMLKKNEKYSCLQVLVDYKGIKKEPNIELDIISIIATEDINRNITPKMPDELRFISTTIEGNAPSNSRSTVHN